jgi:pimeloyl-ACP methyl ester carboxylesterase
MSRYVADVLAVLDDAQVEEAAFVGYSLGARVGYAVAQAAPDRLCGLVAIDSVPDRVTTPGELRADAREILTRGTADVIDEMAAYEEEPAPPWLVEHLRTTDTLAFAGGFEAEASEPDLWAAAPSLRVPVLLVIGLDDDEDRRAVGRDLAATLPDGELLELQAQHLAAFHRSDLTLPAISAFLDRLT